ncbi:MAG: ATP-binding protein, partial [Campylobacterota bacterium]|nr:ATP-binding protein [Campylobacterota bacterium]
IYNIIPKDQLSNLQNKIYNDTNPYKVKSNKTTLNLTTIEKNYEKSIDYSLAWKVLLIAIIIIFIGIFWYRKLNIVKKELEESLNDFEYLFNNTIEAIALFQNNICVDINEAGIKLFNTSKNKLLGKNILEFIPSYHIELAKEKLSKKTAEPYEIDVLQSDGSIFPALIKDYDKNIKGIPTRVTSLIDLTKLKENEKQLLIATKQAEEATQTKSSFLANMSHEIRTPLNGIIGMIHLLQKTQLNSKQFNYLKTIDTSTNNLLNIINDILDFSKIEAGKLKIEKIDFNLEELISNITDLIDFKIKEKNILFDIIYENNLNKKLFGDPLRLSQILINLINNAIKFTNNGSVKVVISSENDMFEFKIIDTGIGIDKEEQNNLFESFNQGDISTTRKYGGTGLGLSISKQLIELMNGEIKVKSTKGKGSTFIIKLKLEKAKDKIKTSTTYKHTIEDINTLN